jgi:class 3 adenylate cyclase
MKKAVRYTQLLNMRLLLTFPIFTLLTFCAVNKGDDGSHILNLNPSQFYLYGNASSLYFFDNKNEFNLDSITRLPDSKWIASKHNSSFGIGATTIWLRLDIFNPSEDENWVINIDNDDLKSVSLFCPREAGNEFIEESAGMNVPISKVSLLNRYPMLPFHLKKNTSMRCYLRFEMETNNLIPLRFFTKTNHTRYESLRGFFTGSYYGSMLLLLMYNFVLYISTRDRLFLFYCLYLFHFTSFIFMANQQWMPWFDLSRVPGIVRLAPVFSILATIFALIFAKVFLFPDQEKSRIKNLMLLALFLNVLVIPFIISLPLVQSVFLANVFPGLAIIAVSIAAVLRFKEGFSGARYFLIAWSFLLTSALLFILMNLGLIDFSNFIAYSPMYGSVIEGIFLSLGIGDRINRLKLDREEAKQALIASQEKAILEEKRINESISRFVPNQFLEILKRKTILDVFRGDSVEQNLTILFSDIRNFTNLSESKDAKEVFELLNEYMERLGPAIAKHHGFIDKYIGDAIMALFPGGPADAIFAALAMKSEVVNMRDTIFRDFHLDAGFGIHYGSVMLGTVGEANRLDTTVIGDNVNLASRLEGLTKNYGISIIVSDSITRTIPEDSGLEFREIDSVIVKGKTVPIVIYEVLNADSDSNRSLKKESHPYFFTALHEYKSRNFEKALEYFSLCLKICPEDSVAESYKKRTLEYIQRPPSPDWIGIQKF